LINKISSNRLFIIFFIQTFAEWKVDYLKLDGCYADATKFDTGYPLVTKALNKTGRPIVFSCSWPAYVVARGLEVRRKMTLIW
jgi:alpha-N-acetylgalactosaminidase